jgi:tryptophan synthase alpha chain
MSAIDTTFNELRSQGKTAFIPFITAGDPDLEFTGQVLTELAKCGASICELGIPYSDPIADGPVIQASYTRALNQQIKLNTILDNAQTWTTALPTPLVTMVSYSIIHRQGLERYVEQAKQAGVAGAIVPDLLVEEAPEFAAICEREDFSLIQLVTPTTPRDRALRICETTSGFLYYVSVTGITGARQELPPEVVDQVSWLKSETELPVCIGFGISQAEQVKILSQVADGIIVGSAIVKRVAAAAEIGKAKALENVRAFVQELIAEL